MNEYTIIAHYYRLSTKSSFSREFVIVTRDFFTKEELGDIFYDRIPHSIDGFTLYGLDPYTIKAKINVQS